MFAHSRTRTLLLTTALTLPLGGMASAQSLVEINEQDLSGKSQECQDLAAAYRDTDDPTVLPEGDVVTAINNDATAECTSLTEQLASGADEALSEEVDLSQDATIEGQARVTVPEPNVDVQVPATNVRVTQAAPQVSITQDPTSIEAEQEQPTISVEIPEVIVRVQIPAPSFYVLESDPQVQVRSEDPQIDVEQAEPTIDVTQDDPNLAVNLGVDAGDQGNAGDETQTSGVSSESTQSVDGDVSTSGGEPQVEVVDAKGAPEFSYESGDPTVEYRSPEPKVTVTMAEDPSVQIDQTGEATVMVETAEEREQRRARSSASQEPQDEAPAESQPATSAPSAGQAMPVADLMEMEVVTSDGEGLGQPAGFTEVDGEPHLVLSSGGFLGIGNKQVPVPMSRVTQQGEELVLDAMTEDDVEAANDFRIDESGRLPDDREIGVTGG